MRNDDLEQGFQRIQQTGLSSKQRSAVVDAMLQLPGLQSLSRRISMIDELAREMDVIPGYSENPRDHLLNILDACLERPNGLLRLVGILGARYSSSPAYARLIETLLATSSGNRLQERSRAEIESSEVSPDEDLESLLASIDRAGLSSVQVNILSQRISEMLAVTPPPMRSRILAKLGIDDDDLESSSEDLKAIVIGILEQPGGLGSVARTLQLYSGPRQHEMLFATLRLVAQAPPTRPARYPTSAPDPRTDDSPINDILSQALEALQREDITREQRSLLVDAFVAFQYPGQEVGPADRECRRMQQLVDRALKTPDGLLRLVDRVRSRSQDSRAYLQFTLSLRSVLLQQSDVSDDEQPRNRTRSSSVPSRDAVSEQLGDVAQSVESLRNDISARFESMRSDFAKLRDEFGRILTSTQTTLSEISSTREQTLQQIASFQQATSERNTEIERGLANQMRQDMDAIRDIMDTVLRLHQDIVSKFGAVDEIRLLKEQVTEQSVSIDAMRVDVERLVSSGANRDGTTDKTGEEADLVVHELKDNGQSSIDSLRRRTVIQFPPSCAVGTRQSLSIQLLIEQDSEDSTASDTSVSNPSMGQGIPATTLSVVVSGTDFDIDPPCQPLRLKPTEDSLEIKFDIVPRLIGTHEVDVEFYREADRIGYVVVATEVTS